MSQRRTTSFCFRAKHAIRCLIAALCCILPSDAVAGDTSESLLARFKSEAPQAWRLVESADELPGTVRITTKIRTYSGGQLTKTAEKAALLRRKPGYLLFEWTKDGVHLVLGQNPHYSFEISKQEGKDEWRLDELARKGHKDFAKIHPSLFEYLKPNGYGFVTTLGRLSKLVSSSQFKPVRAEKVRPAFIRVYFTTVIPIPQHEMTVKGWMDLDTTNAWALQRAQYLGPHGASVRVAKVFSTSQNGEYQPCQSWETIAAFPKNNLETRQQTMFEMVDASIPEDQIFTMAHHGLPEPMGVPSLGGSSSPWYVWFIAGAVLCLAAGALLWRRVRRRKLTTA